MSKKKQLFTCEGDIELDCIKGFTIKAYRNDKKIFEEEFMGMEELFIAAYEQVCKGADRIVIISDMLMPDIVIY